MTNKAFNARHGVSVGTTPTEVIDSSGNVLTNAATASKLLNSRTISLSGDVVATGTFDGSGNLDLSTSIQANSVALGTDTTGNYMVNVAAGTGVSVSHTQSEGSTATVSIGQSVGTSDSPTFADLTLTGQLKGPANFIIDPAAVGDNTGKVVIKGDLQIDGTTTTINSTTITVDDVVLTLGGDTVPTTDDTYDKGIEYRWYDTQSRVGFFGFDRSTGKLTFIPQSTVSSGAYSGTKGEVDAYLDWSNVLNKPTIDNTTYDILAVAGAGGAYIRLHGSSGSTDDIKLVSSGGTTISYTDDNNITISSTSVGDGTLSASAGTAGATNTTVALNFSGEYSANATTNRTINPVVGPALTALATLMTSGNTGFIKRTGVDTYSIDTNTYLTSYTETDTLATVTGRGATTSTASTFSGGLTVGSSLTLSSGVANGVAYLNGSKVLTTGSALTFDGTNLGIGVASATYGVDVRGASGVGVQIYETSTGNNNRLIVTQQATVSTYNSTFSTGSGAHAWQLGGSEQMRLTSTGLGIGTSSPAYKLDVNGTINSTGTITQNGTPVITKLPGIQSFKEWYGLAASGAQARRYVVARVYGTPAHWVNDWQNMRIRITHTNWSMGYVDYNLFGYYNQPINASWVLRVKDADGVLTNSFRVSLGAVTAAGWNYSGQPTYYQDVYVDVDYYNEVTVAISTLGHGYRTTNPTDGSEGCYTVFYDTPAVSDITYSNDDKESSYHKDHKIWNDYNLTNLNQLTNGPGYITDSQLTRLYSPNGGTVVSANAAFPSTGNTLIYTLANGPSNNDGHIIAMSWSNTSTSYGAQLWLDTDPTNRMAVRSRNSSGVWNGWSEVLTDNNYSNYAAPSVHTHSISSITDEHRIFNNMGDAHTQATDFNAAREFGVRYYQGGTNGPTGVGSNQFYGFFLGLGNDYDYTQYGSQFYWGRDNNNSAGANYIWLRDKEAGSWGSWRKAAAGYSDSAPWSGISGKPSTFPPDAHTHPYLSAESDTLATVTARGNTSTGHIMVPSGEGTGFCFWGDSTNYKISMGNTAATYQYGPVTDYSIKMQMSNDAGRGFTWGVQGQKPTAALNAVSGNMTIAGAFAAASKSFLIPHPTKEGWKLRYGSLEGPENGVYVRGKLKGNKIELPEYWTKLVDPDSITVTLTPIGKYQKLYVEDISNNIVTVANDGLFAGEINCFYVVYGERVDVDKIVVEYEE